MFRKIDSRLIVTIASAVGIMLIAWACTTPENSWDPPLDPEWSTKPIEKLRIKQENKKNESPNNSGDRNLVTLVA